MREARALFGVRLNNLFGLCGRSERKVMSTSTKVPQDHPLMRAPGPLNNKLAQQYEQIAVAALAEGAQP